MRKYLCMLLMVLLAMGLAACSSDEPAEEIQPETTQPIVEEEQQVIPEPELEPTPEPEPVELLDPGEIILESNVNRTLNVSYQFPSNWETVYGKHTLCYVEPTTPGIEPARMAISCKSVSAKPGETAMQEQLALLMEHLGEQYDSITPGEIKYGVGLLGEKGYRQSYTATINGQEVTGYAVMAYKNGNIYLLHLSAETQRYEALADVWYNIRMAVLTLS